MTASEDLNSSYFQMGVSLWLSFCVFACLWFLSRFVTGRRQLRGNLHVIEDGLRRMQEEIDKKQRENSMGYGEDLEQLAEELFNSTQKSKTAAKMRTQKVGVDVWKMVFSSCSYLGLACAAWILIKLVYACFWLPKYLKTEEEKEKQKEKADLGEDQKENATEEALPQDKKND